MRIALVSTLYPPELNAGGTLACHELAKALAGRGHEVRVFAGSAKHGEAPLATRTYELDGIPVQTTNVAPGYFPVLQNYRNASVADRFETWLDAWDPDVVHFHSLQAIGADVIERAKARGAGVVLTMHDGWFVCAQQFFTTPPPRLKTCPAIVDTAACDCIAGFDFAARRRRLDEALSHVDRVLAPSKFLADTMRRNGLPAAKIEVCENALPPARPARRRQSAQLRFAYLGGGHPWKGSHILARAIARLERSARFDLHGVSASDWLALGGGEDPRVHFHGPFQPGDLPRVLARADVVIVPSLCLESFSLVTREAMQHGLPVIASRCGGPEEIVQDGVNGLLFPRGDDAALAMAMARFVDEPAFAAAATSAARESAKAVRGPTEHVAQVEAVYEDVSRAPARAMTTSTGRALPSSVLLLSGIAGAPYRYRVTHLREQLGLLGVPSEAFYYRDCGALERAAAHDVVVFNRVPWDPYVERCLQRARAAGALTVFGVDDLVFDPAARIPALATLSPHVVRRYWHGVGLLRKTFSACDAFLTTTESLVRAAAPLGKPAFVHRNALSRDLVTLSAAARDSRRRNADRVRIGYLSGTDTHDLDFAVVAPALERLMAERDDVDLVLVGHLALPRELERFSARIERVPFMSWRELPRVIASLDVNLAPLQLGYEFCDAKSELKWFEAAAAGVPTIASPTEPFRLAIRHGETGLLAGGEGEWLAALRELAQSADLRERIGSAAREEALSRYSPESAAGALRTVLGELMALPRRGPRREVPPVSHDDIQRIRERGITVGRAAMEPADAECGPSSVSAAPAITARIRGRVAATQGLFCPEGHLFRIDVLVATYGCAHAYDLELRLVDAASGAELARRFVPAEDACDNAWLAFEFTPVATREDRELVFSVHGIGRPPAGGVSLYAHPAAWPAGRGRVGRLGGIDLEYRTWLKPRGWQPDPHADREARLARMDALLKRMERVEARAAAGPLSTSLLVARDAVLTVTHTAREFLRHPGGAVANHPFVQRHRNSAAYRAARAAYRLVWPFRR